MKYYLITIILKAGMGIKKLKNFYQNREAENCILE